MHGGSSAEVERMLASVPLLATLDGATIRRLARDGKRRRYAAGETILEEGTRGVALFIVLSGRVRVEKGPTATEAALGELGPGEFFGELALIEEHPRTASVVAVEETECLLIVAWEFSALLKEHPQIAVPIMRALIARLHRAEHRP
ncbi:MAG: cyclic nucleotide-binding domain-containing protein [Chloroflexota bacterium]|nr:cyclic nucleotide-binding domain-containing protein [Chloroflexota bacterium]